MPTPLELLCTWVSRQAPEQADWFNTVIEDLSGGAPERDLHIALGLAPRKLGRGDLVLSDTDLEDAETARDGWNPGGWSIDGAARVAALLAHGGQRPFADRFKDLRRTADVGEMIALYRGLPLYPEPEKLDFETGEGLRSNIRAVFEAIAHHNPYPRDRFDEHRWNHMILKALFVDSTLHPIVGLDERANPELARILRDYAHERWAAHRPVTPELWRCVGPFADADGALDDLNRALDGDGPEASGAALALASSSSTEAAALLETKPDLGAAIASGALTWESLMAEETAP
ncbi:MAG: EboA domain-containing protein [Pseudomonadota bacterium]